MLNNILIFSAGFFAGLIMYALERVMDITIVSRLLTAFGQLCIAPFTWMSRSSRKQPEITDSISPGKDVKIQKVDAREQQIHDTAQTIRSIMINLASIIQHTNKAAEDSSSALTDVKKTLGTTSRGKDLNEAHSFLIHEVDRVITSNSNLKGELAHSQQTLSEQKQLIEDLRSAVRIDGLTKLANRAYFDEKISTMIKLYQRYKEPFCVMMIDVDKFKNINDTYGHQGGDRILKGVALKLTASLRGSDFIARFGGDEFAVILPKTNAKEAIGVARKLCSYMNEDRFVLDGVPIGVTLSTGLAEMRVADTEVSLMKRADSALYHVKETGRNGVFISENS